MGIFCNIFVENQGTDKHKKVSSGTFIFGLTFYHFVMHFLGILMKTNPKTEENYPFICITSEKTDLSQTFETFLIIYLFSALIAFIKRSNFSFSSIIFFSFFNFTVFKEK